jgi:hypothetical protein
VLARTRSLKTERFIYFQLLILDRINKRDTQVGEKVKPWNKRNKIVDGQHDMKVKEIEKIKFMKGKIATRKWKFCADFVNIKISLEKNIRKIIENQTRSAKMRSPCGLVCLFAAVLLAATTGLCREFQRIVRDLRQLCINFEKSSTRVAAEMLKTPSSWMLQTAFRCHKWASSNRFCNEIGSSWCDFFL